MVDEKPKEVKDSSIDNDEIFISLTKERIDQEISNLSADETKASIIIGVVAAVFGITFTVKEYLEFLLVNGCAWTSIGLLLPSSSE